MPKNLFSRGALASFLLVNLASVAALFLLRQAADPFHVPHFIFSVLMSLLFWTWLGTLLSLSRSKARYVAAALISAFTLVMTIGSYFAYVEYGTFLNLFLFSFIWAQPVFFFAYIQSYILMAPLALAIFVAGTL